MSGIAFERVTKVFPDGTVAVVELNLRIHDGEFFVLVGSSGCGKSTALRLVAGLEEPTRGTIRIGDRVVNGLPSRERDISMVFETSVLYPHLDVAENIGFSLKLKGEPEARRTDQVRDAASRLSLTELLGRRPRQLSKGQRQRTALGRAAVRRPQAFLMDEPLSDLDARLRLQARTAIARLHRDSGATVLYVTHDQEEAMALGDRVAVMRDGRLEQVDDPRVLYARPATLFVATFIGSPPMNLCHVRLAERAGSVVLVLGGHRLEVPDAVLAEHPGLRGHVGHHLVLGLRPEALSVVGPRAGGAVLELPVTLVEALGSHLLVHLEAEGAGMQLAEASEVLRAGVRETPGEEGLTTFTRPTSTLVARLPPYTPVEPGERLRLRVDLRRAHFFDPATQLALP